MGFSFDIPETFIQELGKQIVNCEHVTPMAFFQQDNVTMGMRGSAIYVILDGVCHMAKYWELPERQGFFIFICLHRWIRQSENLTPCYLGSEMSTYGQVQQWGEGEA